MKVALITPWDNAWVPYFRKGIEKRGHQFKLSPDTDHAKGSDVVLHAWATGEPILGARNVYFLRRYELFSGALRKVDWRSADALIVVNSWIKSVVEQDFKERGIKTPVHLFYNGTDLSKWTYKDRKPGKKIGMACHVHPKKNLPLAMQIMGLLPNDYELHIAGGIQDSCTAEYLNHLGRSMGRQVYLYDHIPREHLDLWWDQMNYCLSTSISEGNPNNVIEAMAKGICPIVHNWPGAKDQFDSYYLFDTAQRAANLIKEGLYYSKVYRDWVSDRFSLDNYERVLDIVLESECASV